MRALLARGVDQPLTVEEVELPDPGPGEVRVRVRAAGVCHSDLSMVNGTVAPPYPLVLGHEAAGEVIEVDPALQKVKRPARWETGEACALWPRQLVQYRSHSQPTWSSHVRKRLPKGSTPSYSQSTATRRSPPRA
ncbi:alcohol dehydrogenase catalytic domain-containing protein [Micromonospora tulbaghiae]